MRFSWFRLRLDPNQAGGGGAFALPTSSTPGETVGVITTGDTPAPQPQQQQGNYNVPPPQQNGEHVGIVQQDSADPSWDPWKRVDPNAQPEPPAPDPNQPPAPGQQAEQPAGEHSHISEDGTKVLIYGIDPRDGQYKVHTSIPNNPAAIANYAQTQLGYINQLQAELRSRTTEQPVQQQQQAPPQPQGPSPEELSAIQKLASQYFPEDIDTEPLAKFGAELLRVAQTQQQQMLQQQQVQHRMIQEYNALRQEEPRFDVQRNELAAAIHQDYPTLGIREKFALWQYWDGVHQKQNGGGNPAPPVPASPVRDPNAPPVRPAVVNPMQYQRSNGSGGVNGGVPASSAYADDCVRAYYKMMGNKATPEEAAQTRNDALALERAGGNYNV